jgi:hypothetical protein
MPITNSKDDMLKIKRLYKKKNSYKEKNQNAKYFKNSNFMFYSHEKAIQQFLYDEYGIKVHKNELRGNSSFGKKNYYPDISYYDNLEYNNVIYDIENEKKYTGNIEISKLKYILSTYLDSYRNIIPEDWTYNHDKTRWSRSKTQDKIRKNQRNLKENIKNNTI